MLLRNQILKAAVFLMFRPASSRALAFGAGRFSTAKRPLAFFSTTATGPNFKPASAAPALDMMPEERYARNGGINGFANSTSTSGTALRYANTLEAQQAPPASPPLKVKDAAKQKKKEKTYVKDSPERAKFYPHRQELLAKLSMLPTIASAKGSYLYLEDGTPVLDCLAQYGAVPLGHNHQEINQAVIDHLTSNQATFIQPFMPETTKQLSVKLCELANREVDEESTNKYNYVVFSNSGAETVEAAFKLARTKTKRSKILSATDSFHGKTFGALSATGSNRYSNEHIVCDKNFDKVPLNDIDALSEALATGEYAAFIVEPVQGEGGMIAAQVEYLQKVQELCGLTGTQLIFDEIQTGIGRTGEMFAKDVYGVHPDIILLSKALGGGNYPIGAMITKRTSYSKEFDMKHSSTFAAGGLAAAAALKTLDIMDTTDVLPNVRDQAESVEAGLARLQKKFPEILSFNGKGLMWALDFKEPEADKVHNHLGDIIWNTALSYVICGFLLNEKNLLCMPFLGKPSSIRFEPSLNINAGQISFFLDAIEDVCTILKNQRHDILMSYLIQRPTWNDNIHEPFKQKYLVNPEAPPLKEGEKRRRFAFLCHVLGVDDTIKQLPPAIMHHWTPEEQRKMSKWILSAGRLEPQPTAVQAIDLTSATGTTVTGLLIPCSVSPQDMMMMNKLEKQELMDAYHAEAKAHGVDHIIGLGAFTSVITRSGTQHVQEDQLYTSGNSFTALASAESLKNHARVRGDMANMGAMVIGGKGSVGRVAMMELLQHFGTLNIVGNPRSGVEVMEEVVGDCIVELTVAGYSKTCSPTSSLGKIIALLEKSQTKAPKGGRALVEHLRELAARENVDLPFYITTDATTAVDTTDYVLTATNEGKPFLASDTFRPGTVVFDLARPFDFKASPDCKIEVYEGGLVYSPEKTMWGSTNIAHYPAGQNLACLSETIALAMAGVDRSYSLGSRIAFTEAKEVYDICIEQGFSPLSYANDSTGKDQDTDSDDDMAAA